MVHLLLKIVALAVKLAIPIAGLLVIGSLLDWQWAERATDTLAGVWGGTVEAPERILTRSQDR